MTAADPQPSGARMRRARARRKAGRRVLSVEVDEAGLELALADLGYLSPACADDPGAVRDALEAMLARLCETLKL